MSIRSTALTIIVLLSPYALSQPKPTMLDMLNTRPDMTTILPNMGTTLPDYYQSQAAFEEVIQERLKNTNLNLDKILIDGGWTGSGGGGGFAKIASNINPEEFVARFKNAGKLTNQYEGVQDFTLLDLLDLAFQPDWPTEQSPRQFIRTRIRQRIGINLPPLGSYLLQVYDSIWSAPILDTDLSVNAIKDIGNPVSSTDYLNKIFLQWIYRVDGHYRDQSKPNFLMIRVKPLDDHLKKILSPENYRRQYATLMLHEALYSLLVQEGMTDSMQVRTLVDFLLMPEANYQSLIRNQATDASIQNVMIRGGSLLMNRAISMYASVLKNQGAPQSSMVEDFAVLMKKMNIVEGILEEGIQTKQIPQVVSYEASNPIFPKVYQFFWYEMVYTFMSSTYEQDGVTLMVSKRQAALLLALDSFVRKPWPNFFTIFEDSAESKALWKSQICVHIREQNKLWQDTPSETPQFETKGARVWLSDRAIQYCDSLQ